MHFPAAKSQSLSLAQSLIEPHLMVLSMLPEITWGSDAWVLTSATVLL